MKPLPISKIHSVTDIEVFFKHLWEQEELSFHPDDAFDSYINGLTGEPAFSPTECFALDCMMVQCREVANEAGLDVCGICWDLGVRLLGGTAAGCKGLGIH